MIPQHGFRGLVSNGDVQDCNCDMCVPIGAEWSNLSNTEKMTKMIILKAQIAAEANGGTEQQLI